MDPMEVADTSPCPTRDEYQFLQNSDPAGDGDTMFDLEHTPCQQEPSPPNVQVDDSPLQPSISRNKESLQAKLLMRRSPYQLAEQGILPPLKTPGAFASQRTKLERAQTRDKLKVHFQHRPPRQELIRQHILEDTDERLAPALQEKQRRLKKARLADSLNDHLIHRPGPLELVQKNILHAPERIEKAIKDGVVSFKSTSEGLTPGPSVPNIYLGSDDESSSDVSSSPAGTPDNPVAANEISSSTPSTGSLPSKSADQQHPLTPATSRLSSQVALVGKSVPAVAVSTSSSTIPAPTLGVLPPPPPPMPPNNFQIQLQRVHPKISSFSFAHQSSEETQKLIADKQQQLQDHLNSQGLNSSHTSFGPAPSALSSSKIRSSKKSSGKTKSQLKARAIKFHEYKGPPTAQKPTANATPLSQLNANHSESKYELLLQQQQLFLQWQLELQNKAHKYPLLLPAAPKILSPELSLSLAVTTPSTAEPITTSTTSPCDAHTLPILTVASTPTQAVMSTTDPQPQLTISALSLPTTSTTGEIQPQISLQPMPMLVTVVSSANAVGQSQNIEIRPKPTTMTTSTTGSLAHVVKSDAALVVSNQTSKSSNINSKLNISKLNEWKVNDLKAELKRRNLPVSGSKPQLIDRLKHADGNLQDSDITTTTKPLPFTISIPTVITADGCAGEDSSSTEMIDAFTSNCKLLEPASGADPISGSSMNDCTSSSKVLPEGVNGAMLALLGNTNASQLIESLAEEPQNQQDDIIQLQQRQIEELRQQLQASQHQLQQIQSSQQHVATPKRDTPAQSHRLILQQHVQQRMQQNMIQDQLQKFVQNHSSEPSSSNVQSVNKPVVTSSMPFRILQIDTTTHLQTSAADSELTNIPQIQIPETIPYQVRVPTTTVDGNNTNELAYVLKIPSNSNATPVMVTTGPQNGLHPVNKMKLVEKKKGVKSQMVDDVLEILISQGELPPSAAQEPPTPTTPGKLPSGLTFPVTSSTPPKPPPLPPANFHRPLPASIPFPKHSSVPPTPTTPSAFNMSKEAQDILKISQDLSNFGKEHAAQQHRLVLGNNRSNSSGEAFAIVGSDSSDIHKPIQLNDDHDMDVGVSAPASVEMNHSSPVEAYSVRINPIDILEELGTLLPSDLEMPMEMDYGDWMDLVPENHQDSQNHHHGSGTIPGTNNNNSYFGNVNNNQLDFVTLDQFCLSQRDPLLSSRSMDMLSGPTTVSSGTQLQKNTGTGASSPVGMHDMWDLAM